MGKSSYRRASSGGVNDLNLSEFVTTVNDEIDMAAAAIIGFNVMPHHGYKIPAATGISAAMRYYLLLAYIKYQTKYRGSMLELSRVIREILMDRKELKPGPYRLRYFNRTVVAAPDKSDFMLYKSSA